MSSTVIVFVLHLQLNQKLRESTEEEEPPKSQNCTDLQPVQDSVKYRQQTHKYSHAWWLVIKHVCASLLCCCSFKHWPCPSSVFSPRFVSVTPWSLAVSVHPVVLETSPRKCTLLFSVVLFVCPSATADIIVPAGNAHTYLLPVSS